MRRLIAAFRSCNRRTSRDRTMRGESGDQSPQSKIRHDQNTVLGSFLAWRSVSHTSSAGLRCLRRGNKAHHRPVVQRRLHANLLHAALSAGQGRRCDRPLCRRDGRRGRESPFVQHERPTHELPQPRLGAVLGRLRPGCRRQAAVLQVCASRGRKGLSQDRRQCPAPCTDRGSTIRPGSFAAAAKTACRRGSACE